MVSSAAAVSGDLTGDNFTDSFTASPSTVEKNISVNSFGQNVSDIQLNYVDNKTSSRTFKSNISGNASQFLGFPSSFTLFNDEKQSYELIADIPKDTQFGNYTGKLTVFDSGNSNFTLKRNISLNVLDDISPKIKDVSVDDVMSTEKTFWNVSTSDNLQVENVSGRILREFTGNDGEKFNETFKEGIVFSSESQDGSEWGYTFKDTSTISQYFLELQVEDGSGNTDSLTVPFQVDGLNSIETLKTNFVFDNVQTKSQVVEKIVDSGIEGKNVSFRLRNLSYGGNETVRIGVLPPEAETPELLDKTEEKTFTEEGVYRLALIHTGDEEAEGTHRVDGELTISKPSQHVEPTSQNVSFSGTVKNLDKPSEKCLRVEEFDSCISYSLEQAESLFDDEYGVNETGDRSYAYLIGRVPTSSVEGGDSWGSETSLTFDQYESLQREVEDKEQVIKDLRSDNSTLMLVLVAAPFALTGLILGVVAWYFKVGRFIAVAVNRDRKIRRASVDDPEGGLK